MEFGAKHMSGSLLPECCCVTEPLRLITLGESGAFYVSQYELVATTGRFVVFEFLYLLLAELHLPI